ncbi:hypothetical protein [Pantoea dispersa]|uniref:hypothetical protein n=1 Tax=Pantoea dispersa TaxID=59814 RepID=UPI000FD802B6|nr:hypothetical protein [Pantoea dispersa]RVU74701.1 hypothetical protein EKH82_09255 [Pantoea dispersa]
MSWRKLYRGKNQVILTDFTLDVKEGNTKTVYLVSHYSHAWKTQLEQSVTIERDAYGRFKPTVSLDDFPQGLSERESMLKLADWLHRLGVSIEDHWSKP